MNLYLKYMTLQSSNSAYLEQCSQALVAEQTKSLAESNHWSHVDKQKVHMDWDALYKELAPLVDNSLASSAEVQALISRHHSIALRFYTPSREAYIGMGLFYKNNPDMMAFHNAYHPEMVDFLGEAIYIYAQRNL
jgi:hypothetical protein